MGTARLSGDEPESFALGWLKKPGRTWETIGSVTLPNRPTTLGEARSGLEMVADDARTARWLETWAEAGSEERSILLRLPGGWFELSDATITFVAGARSHYLVRFDRRTPNGGPAA
jgi:hypothetical protein